MTEDERTAVERELDDARQLLQVGVLLVGAAIVGNATNDELQDWIDAVAKFGKRGPRPR